MRCCLVISVKLPNGHEFGKPPLFPYTTLALAILSPVLFYLLLSFNHPIQETQHSSQTALPSAVLAQARGGVGEIIQTANRAFGAPRPCRGKKRLPGHVRQGIWWQSRLFALRLLVPKPALSFHHPPTTTPHILLDPASPNFSTHSWWRRSASCHP